MKMLIHLTHLIADVETGNDDDASRSSVSHNSHSAVHGSSRCSNTDGVSEY